MDESTDIKIGILSLTERKDIKQFTQRHKKPRIRFCDKTLEFNDLQKFEPPREWNAVILLHSAKLGRLSLTDVPDARYEKLLKDLEKAYKGKEKICVIADDVNNFREHSREEQLRNLKSAQKSAFKYAENVILCDTLNKLHEKDLEILDTFFGKVYRAATGEELHKLKAPAKTWSVTEGTCAIIQQEADMEKNQEANQSEVVLVTDASGFIGSHIVQRLIRRGYKVRGALDLQKGTLDSIEKGTLDNVDIETKVKKLKGLFPKLDLVEAGIRHYSGWRKAVTGCSHVIHTSRFRDDKPAKEDDVIKLLQVCQHVGGIKRVVVTGGREMMSENELRNEEWRSVNSALKDVICKQISEKAALKFMGFQREQELWDSEWMSINSALKNAIYKYVSEKAAKRFMGREKEPQKEKTTFGLSIIKPPVVLGPILCEIAEANVELVSRRMENTTSGRTDICISVCDVRDVAEYHIEVMQFTDDKGILFHRIIPQCLSLGDMSAILKSEFKGHDNWFTSTCSPLTQYFSDWDDMSQYLQDLHGNKKESNQDMDLGTSKSVIDMAYSCLEHGFIPKIPGYRPREQRKRYRDETTDEQGSDIADDARKWFFENVGQYF